MTSETVLIVTLESLCTRLSVQSEGAVEMNVRKHSWEWALEKSSMVGKGLPREFSTQQSWHRIYLGLLLLLLRWRGGGGTKGGDRARWWIVKDGWSGVDAPNVLGV
jgi:hypothetical protein